TGESTAAWWFLAPALLLLGGFYVLPVLLGAGVSITDFDLYTIGDWRALRVVWARNLAEIVANPLFWSALRTTLLFAFMGTPLAVAVALGAALLLDATALRGRAVFRTLLFAPFVTTVVAVAIVWRAMYHVDYGLVNWLLGLVGIAPRDWLGDPQWAVPAIVVFGVWKSFGYNMLILLAGLQTIPAELHDAATLDGASRWQRLRTVTLPALAPGLVFVVTISLLGFLQLFAEPYVMTRGGPARATTTVVLLMYEEGFRWWRMGVGSAIAIVLCVVLLGVAWFQRWADHRWRLA
nr:sugar ABC transporter permease [Gemmatimonadaceae bacterium]